MKLGKKKRLKCNIDGSSRLSESDSETEFIFSVKTKPEPAKSWPTLHVILITLAFIAICTVTTVALWLSGLFSSFSHLNTLVSEIQPTEETVKETELEPNTACVPVPRECKEYLPYQTTSRFLPRAHDLNVTRSANCGDHNRRLATAFHCFLKYPPCAASVPKVCQNSCPSRHCLAQGGDELEIMNPEEQSPLSTHYISRSSSGNLKMSNFYTTRELQKHYCQMDNTDCLNLEEKFDCGEEGVSCLMTGQCMSREWICDSINDCGLWEDEVNCPACAEDEFKCGSGECIPKSKLCDGYDDCLDVTDELNCAECSSGQFKCSDGSCIPHEWRCDGDVDCDNGADEHGCSCKSLGLFTCADGRCLSKGLVCDGVPNCSHGDDELECEISHKRKPGRCDNHQFWCEKSNSCLLRSEVCSSACADEFCKCAKTSLPICPGVRAFPSPLDFLTDSEVLQSNEYSAVSMILRTSCHSWLRELSCGFLSPGCEDNKRRLPCQSLCEEVRNSCTQTLLQIGLSWPPFLSCSSLPTTECLGKVNDHEVCPPGSSICSAIDTTCIPDEWRCDGYEHCLNGEDERNCACDGFECKSGRCLKAESHCNGEAECEDSDDEENCPKCRYDQHQCSNLECIASDAWCDGFPDCSDSSDEVNCISRTASGVIAEAYRGSSLVTKKSKIGELATPKWNALCEGKWAHKEEELQSLCTRLLLNPLTVSSSAVQVNEKCPATLTTEVCPVCGVAKSRQRRVLSGRVNSDIAPWVASISIDGHKHMCGGTLITNKFVLSAAHCFYKYQSKDLSKWRVRIGQRTAQSWIITRKVKSLTVHPLFQAQTFDFDLSLIKLAQSAPLTVACMPPAAPTPGQFCRVSGWGQVGPRSPGSRKLKSGNVHIVDNDLCVSLYPYQRLTSRMLCAGHHVTGVDACPGDSGGPLECKFGDSWAIVGIVSWGTACQPGGAPGVYTNVNYLREWIAAQL